jgi:hypothetical protein
MKAHQFQKNCKPSNIHKLWKTINSYMDKGECPLITVLTWVWVNIYHIPYI